jgi:hypothetical protein
MDTQLMRITWISKIYLLTRHFAICVIFTNHLKYNE